MRELNCMTEMYIYSALTSKFQFTVCVAGSSYWKVNCVRSLRTSEIGWEFGRQLH